MGQAPGARPRGGARGTHRLHRPSTLSTGRHLEVRIVDPLPKLNVTIRVELVLPRPALDLALELVPGRVELAEAVLERVAPCRGVAREAVRVAERAVQFEDGGVERGEGGVGRLFGLDGRGREVDRQVFGVGAVMQAVDVLLCA